MEVFAYLVRSCDHDVIHMDGHGQFFFPVLNHAKHHGPDVHCSIPDSTTVSTNNPAYWRPPCFRSYCDLFRWPISPDMSPHSPGSCMYISAPSFAQTEACAMPTWKKCQPSSLATTANFTLKPTREWFKRSKIVYILPLARNMSHKSGLCRQYQAILVRLVGKHSLRTYRCPPLWRSRGFLCTGRFVTAQLSFHGLVTRRFLLGTL